MTLLSAYYNAEITLVEIKSRAVILGPRFDGLGFDGLGFDGLGFDGFGFDGGCFHI